MSLESDRAIARQNRIGTDFFRRDQSFGVAPARPICAVAGGAILEKNRQPASSQRAIDREWIFFRQHRIDPGIDVLEDLEDRLLGEDLLGRHRVSERELHDVAVRLGDERVVVVARLLLRGPYGGVFKGMSS